MLDVSDRILWVRDGAIDREERRSEMQIDLGTVGGKTVL
jgi:putative ABC transport system ATP-binding protein